MVPYSYWTGGHSSNASMDSDTEGAGQDCDPTYRCLRGAGYLYVDWAGDHTEPLLPVYERLRRDMEGLGGLLMNAATFDDFLRFVYRHTWPNDAAPSL